MPSEILSGAEGQAFSRRVKALACTTPLHELDAHKNKLDWVAGGAYQMREIALHVIDAVAMAMGFNGGASHDEVVEQVTRFVTHQAPDRSREEHERVARWVLSSLINLGDVDRGFKAAYGEINDSGDYELKAFHFKLLEERRDGEGELYLRASDEALNVLVGALDTDVESAQIAAEVRLQHLISRGLLANAKYVAEQALVLTIRYAEQIRAQLDATRRDVTTVDWLEAVPELLNLALDHVEERMKTERAIAVSLTEARDESRDPQRKRHAAELVDIVENCVRRHIQLQRQLMNARDVFRSEQDRQQFSGPPRRDAIDLYSNLLRPVLDLPVGSAVTPAERFFTSASGPLTTDLPYLATLVPLLLAAPPERTRLGEPVPEPEFAGPDHPTGFTDEQWRVAETILDLPGEVRTLTSLIEEAERIDPDGLADLVALLGLNALSPAIGTARVRGDHHVTLAVPSGVPLEAPGFGGDELLLTTALLSPDEDSEPADEP
ncbi:hypothetical protein ACFQ08_00110 [Streptosporangium algeriense]|uniref:DUF3375 domain-containing protein n=1 Tax=Streptosporangium algeriense TaxID=1682748 RepID=A0ABW3DIF9_9ACTN